MAVSSINSYNTLMSLTDYMVTDKSASTEDNTTTSSTLGLAKRNSIYNSYGANAQTGIGQQAMLQAIEEIKAATGGPVTFDMIASHRAELESQFTKTVQVGLALMGVEESEDFQLLATAEGEVEIICEDQELKKQIQALFEKTEGMKEQFLYIQALGNIERTKQVISPRSELAATKATLGSQAVDIFLKAAAGQGMGYSSLLGNYTDNTMQFLLGANFTV